MSRPMSSEDARESPPSQKVSSAGGFWKNKEVLSSQTPSASLSQTSDFQHESLLFTKPHLAEMEKIFQNEVNSTGALDMKAFVKAVKKILSHVTDEMLELLFLKVDTDCNGLVTWVRRAPPLPQLYQIQPLHHQQMWVVDMACLHNMNLVAIASTDQKIDHWTSVSTEKLLNEKSPMYRSYRLKALHPNWCQLVKFIPQLNVVASCSAIDKSSLVLTVLPSKAPESLKLAS